MHEHLKKSKSFLHQCQYQNIYKFTERGSTILWRMSKADSVQNTRQTTGLA